MHTLMRFTLVCVCATFLIAGVRESKCEDVGVSGAPEETVEPEGVIVVDAELDKKDSKAALSTGSTRRPMVTQNNNGTRDTQLLSLLAARRRQLLNGRLATHLSTLATLAQKPFRNNTTFAQLELRDSNSTVIKRITIGENSTKDLQGLRIETTTPTKDITRQEIRPQDVRQMFSVKALQDAKTRGGFLNNRRKELLNSTKIAANSNSQEQSEKLVPLLYSSNQDEKLDGIEQEAILDPDEEFQVDESNHGIYFLNYSDTNNVTERNLTLEVEKESKDLNLVINETQPNNNFSSIDNHTSSEIKDQELISVTSTKLPINMNATENRNTKQIKLESDKEKENNTLFMSDELYNHFRPLESELAVEDMAPFLFFGQKISGSVLNGDNLTNAPLLSASTKSVNFIVAPSEKRKFNSRYSATEKYKNTSVDEEELNEDMDVSVVKNIIEKNKIRNSVKGPAPARHVGLVNAYRKPVSITLAKPPDILEQNSTEIIPTILIDKNKDMGTLKSNTSLPRNFTRNYLNLRRRPPRVSSTESSVTTLETNTTTEKPSTLVYTAVVTSVSITSSVKGLNKTDSAIKDSNNTSIDNATLPYQQNLSVPSDPILNNTDTSISSSSTPKTPRHRVRIRTTTERNYFNNSEISPTLFISSHRRPPNTYFKPQEQISDGSLFNVATSPSSVLNTTRLVDEHSLGVFIGPRLADVGENLEKIVNPVATTKRPSNTFKHRRRPTTTTTTTTTTTSPPLTSATSETLITIPTLPSSPTQISSSLNPATESVSQKTDNLKPSSNIQPITMTMKSSVEATSKTTHYHSEENKREESVQAKYNESLKTNKKEDIKEKGDKDDLPSSRNEEVVIEAEKTYTASYVLAGLGFLPVTAIVVFVLRNVLLKKAKEIDTDYEGYFDDGDMKKESPITPVARLPIPPAKPDQKWEFPRNKLRLQTLLGQGNFGQVWKAEADDLTGHDGLTRLVAVKSIKEAASQKEKQELLHEICIMQKIGTHPNVVTLLACCTEQEPYLLIMEYVMCGKLLTYLRERRSRPDRFGGSGALTSRDLTVFAYCVARGMDYLASKGIVHRDLAARNVLVDHNKLCKIADFGMSRAACAGDERHGRPQRHALPVRWMAPEALLYNVYNHETDVWAYGILLWEIVTLGSTPYAAMSGREVLTAVTEGYRLERPTHCKPQLYRAMHACWHADPAQRPPFADLKSQLADLLDNEPAEGNYVDLDSFYQESSVYSDPSAIIHDDGLSAEYDREPRRSFRENAPGKYDGRGFGFRNEDLRSKFGIGSPRMGGFGIRDVGFNVDKKFNERSYNPDKNFNDRNFNSEKNFTERSINGDKNFNERSFNMEQNFNERKDGKLSTSSFHRERERESALVSRNSFNGFPRLGSRDQHFQILGDGRNKRVSEFECDI